MTVTTSLLADHPEHLPTVAQWLFDEWAGRHTNSTVAIVAERLQSHLQRDRLPLMVVAVDGTECVGCASVREADLSERDDLTPWLASVYVPEPRRRAGIGATLVRAAESEAARLGAKTLYLFTPDKQGFYGDLGW
ncbi:MAG: GNAT family N-acetyltransferase, partial [bacterium]